MARQRRSGGEAEGGRRRTSRTAAEPSFEEALAELEGVVSLLEAGDMPLEQALVAFESGIKLSRRCAATLDAAERRIEILMAGRPGGVPRVEPFGAVDRVGDDEADEDELEFDALESDELESDELEADELEADDDPDDGRRGR